MPGVSGVYTPVCRTVHRRTASLGRFVNTKNSFYQKRSSFLLRSGLCKINKTVCCVLRVPLSCWKHFSGCFHPFFVDLRHFLIIHLKTKHKPKKDKIWVPVQEVNLGCWPALRVNKNIFSFFFRFKITKKSKINKKSFLMLKNYFDQPSGACTQN